MKKNHQKNKTQRKFLALFVLFLSIISIIVLVSAIPLVSFNSPTPATNTWTRNTSIEINVSIIENSLASFVYNWNSTNYTMYNDSLVLMMNFDNVSALGENSTYVVDVSKYGNNGTVTEAVWNSSGKYGGAWRFDGVDDYISISDNPSLKPTGPVTIQFWYNSLTSSRNKGFIDKRPSGNGAGFSVQGADTESSKIECWFRNSSTWVGTRGIQTISPSYGAWHNLVCMYNGSSVISYIDGILDASIPISGTTTTSTDSLRIGASVTGLTPINGSIDEVRIWNRSLTASEIYEQYVSNLNKFNSTQWYFYINQSQNTTTRLSDGTYTYQTFATNSSGSLNQTDLRTLTIDTTYPQINFTSPTPASYYNTTNTSFEINVSISESNLVSLIYNWNSINYTIYDNSSLVLMMNFDNKSALGENSTYVVDVSKYGNNGTLINGTLWNASGKYNGAYQFDGVNDYISAPLVTNKIANVTISAWFKTNKYNQAGQMIVYVGSDANANGYGFSVNQEGTTDGTFYVLYGGVNWYDSGRDITDSNWHHGVLVINSTGKPNLYLDGTFIYSNGVAGSANTPTLYTEIGRNNYPAARYFNGSIDEVRIWNRSLSADEIYELYISNLNKFNSTQWYFYANQSLNPSNGLPIGNYSYQVFASDFAGNANQTEQRIVRIISSVDTTPPQIDFVNPTPANYYNTTNTSFEINVSISESNLVSLIYNWNLTNYTIYDNSSLVLMMNFDNRSALGENSTYVADVSKYGNNGTPTSGAFYNLSGRYGGAYQFDGVDDYINISNSNSLNLSFITISGWIRASSLTEGGGPLAAKGNGGGGEVWALDVTPTSPRFYFYKGGSAYECIATTILLTNQWYYIVGTYDGTNSAVYVNGIINKSCSTPQGALSSNTHVVSIGSRQSGSSAYDLNFNGLIDEVRIWNRSLNASEIYQQYASNLQKFNSTQWYFYANQSLNPSNGLPIGNYSYQVFASDFAGNANQTEQRNIRILSSDPIPPQINFVEPTPVNYYNTTNTSVEINVSISESNLLNLIYNWNSTNYTIYDNSSLVLMMNFDNITSLGDNSTYVADVSKYGNNGTLSGGIMNSTSGKYGYGIFFDGINDLVTVPDSNSLDLTTRGTITLWARRNSLKSYQMYVTKGIATASTGYQLMDYGTSGRIVGRWGNDLDDIISINNISIGNWSFIALTYNGSKLSIYINGALDNSTNWVTNAVANTDPLRIGSRSDAGYFFNGSIDEVRIWNRSLNADEIYELYISNLNKFNSTQWYFYANQSLNASNSLIAGNNYSYQVFASDFVGNANQTEQRNISIIPIIWPQILLNWIYPTGNINVTQLEWFNVSVNVTCLITNCTNFNVTLDPFVNTIYNFTTCGASGRTGPNQTQCNTNYTGTTLDGLVNVGNGIQNFTIPTAGIYKIETAGAAGGLATSYASNPGRGAYLSGNFYFTQGQVIKILVGQKGSDATQCGGGGGGSFVVSSNNDPLIIAGGGGGPCNNYDYRVNNSDANISSGGRAGQGVGAGAGGINGNGGGANANGASGGGGFYGNGTDGYSSSSPGIAFISNASGGAPISSAGAGGFGGGGGSEYSYYYSGAGGGGYSGGGGGYSSSYYAHGGGGGSINNGTSQIASSGNNTENGYVKITYLGGIKNGVVSMNSSTIGFYTNVTNPYNISLSVNESQVITWFVNATGSPNIVNQFFIYANLTSNFSLGNQTSKLNITILDNVAPIINITYPLNTSYNYVLNSINYTYSDYSGNGYCWYTNSSGVWNSSAVNAGVNFTNVNSTDGSNTWSVYCNDSSGNLNLSSVIFAQRIPTINLTWIYPTGNINVTQLEWFNVSVNISCANGNCGSINVSLDPTAGGTMVEIMRNNATSAWGSGSSAVPDPINTWYHDSRVQSIYLASDLRAAGVPAGASIRQLYFNISSLSGMATLESMRIRINHTLSNTTSAAITSWNTTAYGPINIPRTSLSVNQLLEFNFTNNFTWDGFSNLVFDFSRDAGAYVSGGGLYAVTGLQNGRSFGGVSDSTFVWPFDGMMSTGYAVVPKIWLTYLGGTSSKGGLISMNSSATPFYTNVTNPYNLTLSEGESQVITWTVNATGTTPNYPYEFFVYANASVNLSISSITSKLNITIKDVLPPIINITYPINNQNYTFNLSTINYTYSDYSGNGYCWYTNSSGVWNSSVSSSSSNGSFSNVRTINGWNNFSVYCNDSSGNLANSSGITFFRDNVYPIFSNFGGNNATMNGSGIAVFNVTILNTNGTVFLEINGSNYTANNISASVWNYSLFLVNGTYTYRWISWGNYTLMNYNSSNYLNYTLYGNLRIINVSSMNLSNVSGVAIPQGTNVTITTFVENAVNVFLKVWRTFIGGQLLWQGFMTNPLGNIWTISLATNSTWPVGEINYTVYANDSLRLQHNMSGTFNISDTTIPEIFLKSPANNTFTNNATQYFAANFTDNVGIVNVSLYIWNSTSSIINITSSSLTGLANVSNLSVILPYDNTFRWNYYACDNSSNCAWNNTNWTITYDSIPPVINVTYPTNTTLNVNVRAINYTYLDTNGNGSCWYSNSSGVWNSSAVLAGVNFTNVNSTEGSNNWRVYCNDSSGNLNFSGLNFVKDTPQLIIERIYPLNNTNVSASDWFNVIVNVSCVSANCGNVNVTLDPPSNPVSCKEILQTGLGSTDGNYTIYPYDNSTGLQVYCDMNTDGGGWTLFANLGPSQYTEGLPMGSNAIPNLTSVYFTNRLGVMNHSQWLFRQNASGNYVYYFVINFSSTRNLTDRFVNMIVSGENLTWYAQNSSGSNFSGRVGTHRFSDNAGITYANWYSRSLLSGDDGIWGVANATGSILNGNGGGSLASATNPKFGYENYDNSDSSSITDYRGSSSTSVSSWRSNVYIRENIAYVPSGKGGTVSMNSSATPFWTNVTNPYNLTLSEGESQVITWTVNASGSFGNTYEFFVYGNLTADTSLGNQTSRWNVTISNITIDLTAPTINLISPVNGSGSSNSNQYFYVNFTDTGGLANYTFYLWNSSNTVINTTFNIIIGNSNESNISISLPYENAFKWNYYSCDNSSNCRFASNNYTFYYDITSPYFINFSNLTTYHNVSVNLSINASDNLRFDSYAINWSSNFNINKTTGLIGNSSSLGLGDYYINITINDTANNINSTVILIRILNATDSTYPLFSDFNITPENNSQYSANGIYSFNVTILNTNGAVGIQFNGTNYSLSNLSSTFNKTFSNLGGGIYAYYFWGYGNGTRSLYNRTADKYYTIAPNSSAVVYLHLNYSRANYTVEINNYVLLNATVYNATGTVKLYKDSAMIGSGMNSISNNTLFNSSGIINITGIYVSNNNYTGASETWWMNVTPLPVGASLNLSWIYPTGNINVSQDNFFNISVNLTCLGANCQNINTTLYYDTGCIGTASYSIPSGNCNASSSKSSSYLCSKSQDNNFGTGWFSLTQATKEYIYWDLGALSCLSGIKVYPWSTYDNQIVNVDISEDGINWTTVLTSWNIANSGAWNENISFEEVSARYVRLNFTTTPSYASVAEIHLKMRNNSRGAISMNSSATPFYTNVTNPYNLSLSVNQSAIITWWVNALGSLNTIYKFHAYSNITNNMSTGYEVSRINITLIDTTAPSINITYPLNTSYSSNVRALNYTYSDRNGGGYCWYSNSSGVWNSSAVNAGINFTNVNSTEGSNTWRVYCNDSFGNLNSSSVNFSKAIPAVGLSLIYPTGDIAVNKSNWFNVSVNVSCLSANCGNINVSLDPIAEQYIFRNISGTPSGPVGWYYIMGYEFKPIENGKQVRELCNYAGTSAKTVKLYNGSYYELASLSVGTSSASWECSQLDNPINLVAGSTYFVVTCLQGSGAYSQSLSPYLPRVINEINITKSVYLSSTGCTFNSGFSSSGSTMYGMADIGIGGGGKGGLVSTSSSATPFYTNVTNPYNISLGMNESQVITWLVNATGTINNNYTFFVYANLTSNLEISNRSGNWNVTITNGTVIITDNNYPLFSNYLDNNGLQSGLGIGYFNVTVNNTNGSVWLSINNTNITATNLTSNVYNVSYNFTQNKTYSYRWYAYGNGNLTRLNSSDLRNYSVLMADTTSPVINIISPANNTYRTTTINLNLSINENASWCGYSLNGASNVSMTLNSSSRGANYTLLNTGQGSNTLIFSCNDSSGNINSTIRIFSVDTLAPQIAFYSPLATFYNTKIILINLSTNSDALNIWFNRGLGNESYTSATLKSFNEGNNTLYAYANDSVGNLNFTNVNFSIDSIAPSLTVNSPLEKTYTTNNLVFNVSTNEDSYCWFALNSSNNYTLYTGNNRNFNYSLVVDNGFYSLVYYCNDSLNNLATKTVVFGVDAVPPQISLNYPAPNSYSRNSTIQFNYTPMASDGLDTCELWGNWIGTWHKNDSTTALVNYSGNYFIKTLRDGTYLWNIWCNNTNGYTDWSMQGNITFSIDNTAPYVSFVLPAAVSYNSSLISVEITNSSDVSSVWWFNGTENISYISSLDLSLSDGTYNFIAYANDSAGNLNSTPVSFNVDTSYSLFYNYRDNNASLVGINSGGNYGGGIGFFNISINNTNGSVLLRINSTNIPALNLNENIYNVNYSFITAGVYEYYWQAYSNGTSHLLSNSETYYYSINSSDNASANIILNTPENNSYTNFTAINFTANLSDITLVAGDTESGIKNATLNIYNSSGIVNQTIVNYAEEILSISVGIVVSLIDGVYNWFYDVFDFAGNWFSSSNNTLTVDLAVPIIEIASPANNYQTNNNQIEINYSIRETNLGSCWFDDQGYSSNNILSACSNISNFLWMDGWHNLTIWSNDSTGNINSSNISFLVDSTPPEVSLNFPEDGYSSSESYTTQIIVNCSATDNLRVKNISLYITNYQNLNMDFYELVPAVGTSGNASWTLNLGKGEYSWNCLASDDLGNSRFAESNRSIILNFSDADDDTIGDSVDNLKGNENSPIVSGINRLNITVGGNSTYGSYNDTREIIFYNSTQRIMNFTFNFTNSSLDLGKIRIIKTVNSLIVNLSGQLQEGYRKTIYIEDNNFAELCVKDSEVTNISEISTGCGEPDETNFTDCLGNSSGVTRNTLLCKDTGEIIEIGNLMYSAARGTCAVEEVVDVPTGSSGSGGGGGSLNISKVECTKNVECGAGNYCFEKKCYKGECTNNSQCSKDTYCFDFRCVKLFDIKIIDIDSPIGAGSFLSFTYYLKAMAEINNDVVVDFWLEKNGEKISSGKDTIYIGNKEEKTENTKIFIPKKVEPGVYDFYISVTFEKYSAQSSRQIEIDEWGNVVIFSVRNIFVYVTLFLILIIVLLLGFIYKMRKRRIQDALDYERRWILTHKFSLAILYLILASLALIGILAFLKIITLPSFTDYILTTENFIRYLVKPYLTLILGITVGILLFSYFLRYRRRNIFRKLYGEGFIPKVENYFENFLRRLKRKIKLEKELFILRIRKRRSANRRLVGKIGEQIEEEKKLLIKELKPKKSKEERIRDKKIAEWKKKGYDVDVIQGENREKLIKEWKKKGYDTEVIEGKSMSEIVKEWKKKGYDVEALGDSFKNP